MQLDDDLRPLIGLQCDNFRLIVGGSLILYLGPRAPQSQMSEWRLHLEPAWRLEQNRRPIIGSFDTPTDAHDALQSIASLQPLIGKRLTSVDVGVPIMDLTLTFDRGYTLRTFAHSVNDGGNWEFRHGSGLRIALADGSICSASRWHELPDETA